MEETLTYTAQLALRQHSTEAIRKKVTRGRLRLLHYFFPSKRKNKYRESERMTDAITIHFKRLILINYYLKFTLVMLFFIFASSTP